ncbi:hypothetical protein J4E89_000091 [Alternaria sp. Ai002NY15]|nr:hypothetical protein J4E89_000091 [Alternaria sp. Ai002NY15]
MLRLPDLGSLKPRVLPADQKDDRDQDLRDVDDVFNNDYDVHINNNPISPQKQNRDKTANTNQRPSPLLLLPAELRNKIYKIVFLNTTININKLLIKKDVLGRYPSVRAVLYTCRQIYIEASALSFTLCTFVPSYFALRFFASSNLPASGFGRVERLWLTRGNGLAVVEGKDEFKNAYLTEYFGSLKRLDVEPLRLKVKLTDYEVRERLRGAFGLPGLVVWGRERGEGVGRE